MKMKSFRDRNPYLVGIVSVLVIGALTGLAFMVGLLRLFEHTYSMSGVFSDAAGLRGGDEVKLAGVKVGRVTGVEADHRHGNVIVTWVVNDGVDLGPRTTAEIALETLLGAKYIRLGGTVERPYVADLPKAERRIPAERTKIPFDVFELTRVGTRGIQQTDTAKLNTFINDLADITDGQRAPLRKLLTGIDGVATAINQRDTQLRTLLERADKLSATLADKDETLVALIDASQRILDFVAARREQLGRALGEGNRFVQDLDRFVAVNRGLLDSILDTLHPTLDVVQKHQGTIDKSLAWLGPGFLQQAQAGTHGPWQDIYVRSLGPDAIAILDHIFDDLKARKAQAQAQADAPTGAGR
jgi:phospholipid/cholesterol/gamma-HCH transport system substrate-binding protein